MAAPEPKPPKAELVGRLRAGIERLLARGTNYAEIPIDALVSESGLAKSTFYVYFDGKDTLLRVLAGDVVQELVDVDDAWWTLPPDATRDEVHAALVGMHDAYAGHGELMRAIVDAAIHDPLMREQFGELLTGVETSIAEHIRACQRAGAVRADLDADRTAVWLAWTVERGFNRMLPGTQGVARERRLLAMTNLIWATYTRGER